MKLTDIELLAVSYCAHKEGHSCQYGLGQCLYCWDYQSGHHKPNYPMPAIPLVVNIGCCVLWIDDVSIEDDPIMVYACQDNGTWTMKDGILDKFTYNK